MRTHTQAIDPTQSTRLEPVESLNWKAELRLEAFGVALGIRTNRPKTLKTMAQFLPPGWTPVSSREVSTWVSLYSLDRPSVRTLHVAFQDSTEVARSPDLDYILRMMRFTLVSHVANVSPSRVFVHSGAVGWQGQALLLPGKSMSGKSTLVAELVRTGAEYYSDEFSLLDPQGRLHPYPKPISLRESDSIEQTDYPIEIFGGRVGKQPLPVGLVLFATYREGANFRPRRLSRGRGTLLLLPHTAGKRSDAARVLDTLQNLGPEVRFLKGVRGEAADVAPLVLERMNGR